MAQYQTVLLSLTKYGTLTYCHICDTLWHSIKIFLISLTNMAHYHTVMISVKHYGTVSNCRDISNKIWQNTILS
jgi:hypothetical protein